VVDGLGSRRKLNAPRLEQDARPGDVIVNDDHVKDNVAQRIAHSDASHAAAGLFRVDNLHLWHTSSRFRTPMDRFTRASRPLLAQMESSSYSTGREWL